MVPRDPDAPAPTPSPPRAADRAVERAVHRVLACGLLPIVSVPLEWVLAERVWSRPATQPGERPWRRALAWLLAFDTVLALTVVAFVRDLPSDVLAWQPEAGLEATPLASPRMGVVLDDTFSGPGERIDQVYPESPADEAGLAPGDVILAIDAQPVEEHGDVARVLTDRPAGAARRVEIERAGEARAFTVVPRTTRVYDRHPVRPLLEPVPGSSCAALEQGLEPWSQGVLPVWIAVGSLVALWAFLPGHRRPTALPLCGGAAVLVASYVMPLVVAQGGCAWRGGPFEGLWPIASLFQGLTLASFSILLLARRPPLVAVPERLRSLARSVVLGLVRAWGPIARMGLLAWVVSVLVWDPGAPELDTSEEMVRSLVESSTSGTVRALWAVSVVALAPIGEELLFRGLLLPSLVTRVGAMRGIALTSLVFAIMHLPTHGPIGCLTVGWLGVVLAWLRLETGSLAAPIVVHALQNGFAFGMVTLLQAGR